MLIANAASAERLGGILDEPLARRVDGLVLATATVDDAGLARCLAANVPTVLVNRAEMGERA